MGDTFFSSFYSLSPLWIPVQYKNRQGPFSLFPSFHATMNQNVWPDPWHNGPLGPTCRVNFLVADDGVRRLTSLQVLGYIHVQSQRPFKFSILITITIYQGWKEDGKSWVFKRDYTSGHCRSFFWL